MPNILESILTVAPGVGHTSAKNPQHDGSWRITMDQAVPSDYALWYAQGFAPGGVPAGMNPMPVMGDRLLWDDEHTIPDTGQSRPDFIAAHPNGYADFGALVQAITGRVVEKCVHNFDVVWRIPEAGQFQQKQFIDLFNDPNFLRTSLAKPPVNPTSGPDVLDQIKLDHTLVRHEFINREIPGVPEQFAVAPDGTVSGTRTPLLGPTGEAIGQPPIMERVRVITTSCPVQDCDLGYMMEEFYANTVNDDVFSFDGRTILKHRARFLSAETGDELNRNGHDFRVCSWRVEIQRREYYRQVPAVGSWYYVDDAPFQQTDGFGFPLHASYPLTSDGHKANTPAEQHIDLRLDYDQADYTKILGDPRPGIKPA